MKTYSVDEMMRMREAIRYSLVFREGCNPHNPYELMRVVEERLRTHMKNGDNARVLWDYIHGHPTDPPKPVIL